VRAAVRGGAGGAMGPLPGVRRRVRRPARVTTTPTTGGSSRQRRSASGADGSARPDGA
jgi:hypothetical protein